MSLGFEAKRAWRKFQEEQYKVGSKSALSTDDVESFVAATEAKPSKKVLNSKQQIVDHVVKSNWVRYRRLQKDYKWLQGRMRELGLNPEEAKWLL